KGNLGVPAFVVAPLIQIAHLIVSDTKRLEEFRQNPLVGFANVFYIPQHTPLPSELMADFTRVFSVPQSEYRYTLSQKVLQMTDEARVLLKKKLTYHFARPTDEEIAAGLVPRPN